MKRLIYFLPASFALLAISAAAQSLQFDQSAVLYSTNYQRGVNYRSLRGVPISNTTNTPPGSDGRAPLSPFPTTNQFKSHLSFGGVIRPTNSMGLINTGITTNYTQNAANIGLPRGTNGSAQIVMVLRSAQSGAQFFSRPIAFLFGSVITPPITDENGAAIATNLLATYWQPQPYTTTGHTNAPYYWSPHAGVVFANQPGPIQIVWKRATPGTATPTNSLVLGTNYVVESGNVFRLTNATYIVSGSAFKTPRKIYWTEKAFRQTGKPVTVPTARVSAINVAYNNAFQPTVATEYPRGSSPTDGQTNTVLLELRTLWYDSQQGQILAYNQEGRVLVELLGDSLGGSIRRHLGYEIVDVYQQVTPADITIELGEIITAYADGRDDSALISEPVQSLIATAQPYLYDYSANTSVRVERFAARETKNLNDVLVHWLEESVAGLRWPLVYTRYQFVWPANITRYSHYVRPLVATEGDAKLTAVPMPTDNVPTIQWQDPLDQLRGKLTESFAYYTFLTPAYPAHRALLRFSSGEFIRFERVFSWLNENLISTNFSGTLATNLAAISNYLHHATPLPNDFISPRVVSQTVAVGDRITAPGELGSTASHLAGYILQAKGNSFHPTAYKDPFVNGFDTANLGAIIPVNAIPGANALEIWWFRLNSVDLAQGFRNIYWPTVIGRYTIQWPGSASEIVLAGNDGSGGLESLQAKGSIYVQNDPTQAGYNPNEEHALMLGGQAFALRDDLNLTANTTPAALSGSGATYSSEPFVLLDYTESDGRPALRAFKVLRENPNAGIVFDYIVTAGGNANKSGGGSPLQAPMPLPFLPAPVEYITNGSGPNATFTRVNYNTEPSGNSGDLPVGWTTDQATGIYSNYARFTYKDRKDSFWIMRGLHAGLPTFEAGSYNTNTKVFSTNLPAATAVAGQPFTNVFHTSRQTDSIAMTLISGSLPSGLRVDGVTVSGIPNSTGSNFLTFTLTDKGDNVTVTNTLALTVATNGAVVAQRPLTIVSTNIFSQANVTYVGRPPFLASAAASTNCFTMRFYYKTQDGFAWPGDNTPPAVGSIVPYLRPANSTADPGAKTTPSLDIVYRPVWPGDPPKMAFGQTLTDPKNSLPAVRGQTSVQLLYQQSIGQNITDARPSVVLHDPTSEKSFALKTNATDGLAKLPDGVKTDLYQGKTYFPNLPPYLAQRFFFDPNRGPKGSLVFQGEFKDEILGEKYLLLNVLRGSDLATVKDLSPASPADQKSAWDAAVDGLTATVVTKYENPQVPGQFIVNSNLTVTKGISDLIEVTDDQTAVNSYALSASGPGQGYVTLLVGNSGNPDQTPAGEPVSLYVFRVTGTLYPGELKVLPSANPLSELVSFQHTVDLAGRFDEYDYEWKINPPVDGFPPVVDETMSEYQPLISGLSLPLYTLGGSGIQGLVDNYIVMRYRPANTDHPLYNVWSDWTVPALAEGWIKRVLAGINPFNQRVTDLYNNTVNTDANILTSAGRRYEGDIALNLANINNYGLIEIYETVLKRGRNLSINADINFGPANDALLLAAGYLNDLYMLVGNEAFADASNPTIGIGTKDSTYGDIATALFAFKGQMPSLLEEELALLRGRDDVAQPGVTTAPVYNRLVWNFTRGIDAGEVIYALNYNILDQNTDGKVNAADAAKLYPQGHGDAYGHYLTAAKGYYSLLLNNNFDWVPRVEAVNILGKPVTVDYLDERKFATAAAAAARTGRQIFDLTWRQDYVPGKNLGWERFSTMRVSTRTAVNGIATNNLVRHWGADQWASRTAQGAFLNWVVGNAILPAVDPDPSHEGIQKIDRTTVPELNELAATLDDLQTALDNAEGRLTPLGLSEGSLAFDLNPNHVVGANPQTHFEQIYGRAKTALNNAVASFDDAKDVTRLLRSEQDSLADFQTTVAKQELAYTNALIELYGTPYADDIGTGKTFVQGFEGPDLLHYMYVDDVTLYEKSTGLWAPNDEDTFVIDIQGLAKDWGSTLGINNWLVQAKIKGPDGTEIDNPAYKEGEHFITYNWTPHGFLAKPANWTGRRKSPGKIQQAISEIIAAHDNLYVAITAYAMSDAEDLFKAVALFESRGVSLTAIRSLEASILTKSKDSIEKGNNFQIASTALQTAASIAEGTREVVSEALPDMLIFGLANGGDLLSPARASIYAVASVIQAALLASDAIAQIVYLTGDTERQKDLLDLQRQIAELGRTEEFKQGVVELGAAVKQVQGDFILINAALRRLDDATRQYMARVAEGDRIQAERLVFRQRAAAVIQGFRTRDAAFRIFRNEKLERYKTLFDLSSRYGYLAANAYDYETGLLGTDAGKSFVNRIVSSRALGVVKNGEPQYAGSNTGDPGLSSTLAEMKADWDVLKGRLGFNNPDAYGTTASLRMGEHRILPGSDGTHFWQDLLQNGRTDNLLKDADVKRYCQQIDSGDGLPVPGIVLTFGTTIAHGQNLFGQPTAAGDVNFEISSFATKIFGIGVALEGYRGMQDPVANGTAVAGAGGTSPPDPNVSYLDPLALNGTPSVYLIPVGVDSMRSPPLGDTSDIRSWTVDDVAIPLPFNIGGSDFSTRNLYQSTDSLTEPLFSIRKHQSFRPVSATSAFSSSIYTSLGGLQRSQFTNNRLIGRSVWNSKWKLVIPGNRLLNDPNEGLARFIKTVTDVKLHFVTYSYAGN